jgi:Class II flagellar assembly regulator
VVIRGACRVSIGVLVMRIVGPNATTVVSSPSAPRHSSGASGFSLPADGTTQTAATQTTALRTVGGIEALIALQSEEDPAERRRRAVKRGRIALDALDELKHALLSGALTPSTLMRLKSAATELKDASGELGLDAVLAEIELRVEVEIAKLSPR